mmetsp:Transcript_18089/g.36989  ORF Transcript_18089/g.36989 Transcript_18089/m.36989 type:complete len:214 (-) Transcript_18089:82-723(-)
MVSRDLGDLGGGCQIWLRFGVEGQSGNELLDGCVMPHTLHPEELTLPSLQVLQKLLVVDSRQGIHFFRLLQLLVDSQHGLVDGGLLLAGALVRLSHSFNLSGPPPGFFLGISKGCFLVLHRELELMHFIVHRHPLLLVLRAEVGEKLLSACRALRRPLQRRTQPSLPFLTQRHLGFQFFGCCLQLHKTLPDLHELLGHLSRRADAMPSGISEG